MSAAEHGSGDSAHHGPSHYVKIWAVLLVLLVISICGPMIGVRAVTLITAFGIAIVKAYMVASQFMHLKIEKRWVSYILLAMLTLIVIFFYGISPDVMKGDGQNWVKLPVEEGALASSERPRAAPKAAASTLKDPWVSTPELVARGKTLFTQNCALCHGPEGKGDGPGGVALTPKPRNFTSGSDKWDNGRSVTGVYKTLKEGVKNTGMASYEGMPLDDRWSLLHFVLSLGPTKVPTPSQADLTKSGILADAEGTKVTLPLDFAIERMTADSRQK